MKALVRRALAARGYEIRRAVNDGVPSPASNSVEDLQKTISILRDRLAWSETLRNIHRRDAIEIEDFLRFTVLPNLQKRPGREVQLSNLIGTNVCEGLYIVAALQEAMAVEGDICEFGVAQGATSALIASEIQATPRNFYLFDSFEGLPAPTKEDKLIDDVFQLGSMDAYKGAMASPESEVTGRLNDVGFPSERTHLRKGWVHESLARGDVPNRVAFAYVDFDFYEPIKVALEWLDTVTGVGARVMVDDYGFFSEGAQVATDSFVAQSKGRWTLHVPLPFAGHFVTLRRAS